MTPSPQQLGKLLERVAQGDEAAFAEIYQATSPKLYAVAVRILRSREAAEEVIQDCYFRVWEQARDFNPEIAAPVTWMTAIVRNRSLDELRRRGSRPTADVSEIETLESDDEHPLETLGRREDVARLTALPRRPRAGTAADRAARLSGRHEPRGTGQAVRPAGRNDQDLAAPQPRPTQGCLEQ